MTDIVERLRAEVDPDVNEPLDRLLDRAADEIERLRKALRDVMNASNDPYEVASLALSSKEQP